jgi:hypothetical protein
VSRSRSRRAGAGLSLAFGGVVVVVLATASGVAATPNGPASLDRVSIAAAPKAAAPAEAAAPEPSSVPAAPTSPKATRPYALDLYRSGDFVAQTNLVQCVGASIQMMANLLTTSNDRTAATQRRLFLLARGYSDRAPNLNLTRKGASVRGWSTALNGIGLGPYRVVGFPTIDEALHAAARAIRVTRRPVGLLMWHGRHAWVMSGFEATADPLATDGFRVTRAVVLDPLYPRNSRTWGASPRPGAHLAVSVLARQFVPRGYGWTGDLAGQYVLVLPQVTVGQHRHRMVAS